MTTLRTQSRPRYRNASEWPSWTDEDVWVPSDRDVPAEFEPTGPTPDDDRWAAENLNDEWPDDEVYDLLAAESVEMDRLERGVRLF